MCSNGSRGATGGATDGAGSVTGANVLPAGVAAAAALLLGCLVPGLALSTGAPANAADEKVTFTVALRNEVDSFNPFVGIEAQSFEMWALTYDYMIDLQHGGHVAHSRGSPPSGRPPRTG